MLVEFLRKNSFFRNLICWAGRRRSEGMLFNVYPFLNKGDKILDIGAGTCINCEILKKKGYKITALDVKDLSFVTNIRPVIYDGSKLPYDDDKFNTSLILTVLHHTPDVEKIIREAKRVSRKIIIIEDIYSNWLEKYITYLSDSMINLEFFKHPHSNKDDSQWKKTFKKLGLKLVDATYSRSFLVFKHATYHLEKFAAD